LIHPFTALCIANATYDHFVIIQLGDQYVVSFQFLFDSKCCTPNLVFLTRIYDIDIIRNTIICTPTDDIQYVASLSFKERLLS